MVVRNIDIQPIDILVRAFRSFQRRNQGTRHKRLVNLPPWLAGSVEKVESAQLLMVVIEKSLHICECPGCSSVASLVLASVDLMTHRTLLLLDDIGSDHRSKIVGIGFRVGDGA